MFDPIDFEDPEALAYLAQKERDDCEAIERFYARTGQKPPPVRADARYLRDGSATDEATWSANRGDPAYVDVDRTTLPNGLRVSTNWIGVDGLPPSKPPSIFETVVFDEKANHEVDRSRTATEPAAREAHRRLVEKWRSWGD